MELKKVALVIADISGYTQFIQDNKTSLLHAEEIISQLLETVIEGAKYPLVLNKLEGDAILMYAELGNDEVEAARDVARQVQAFFAVFRAKAHELATSRAGCPCQACQRILELRLKAILHQGTVAFKKIRQFEEIAGEDVIVAHRLLKNSVPASEYILMTEVFFQLTGDLPHNQAEARREFCKGLGDIAVRVFYPAAERPGRSVQTAPLPA